MVKFDFDKIIHVLKELYATNYDRKEIADIINFGEFKFTPHRNQHVFPNAFNLIIYTDHKVVIKQYNILDYIGKTIKDDINNLSLILVDKIKITPNYDKIEISNAEIRPVYTQWETINKGQLQLIEQLTQITTSIDLQNIGNSCRSILQQLANNVYDENKHKPTDPKVDVSEGKFKNRLHAFIKTELSGDSNKVLRDFALSAIKMVEDAVDLANTLTHKLNANKTFAEVCIIGTIGTISIIKLVDENKKKNFLALAMEVDTGPVAKA
ncbi:MAG TPA: hypothetical protein VHE59_07935 [Mucilaginibacter sp.]|nr:hypothetical protein [Mucilaginibacter sp.]